MITVTLIPILSDNYAYLLEADNGETAIVDPGEAAPIIAFLEAKNIKPDMIFITHHHWDHMDGVPGMLDWHDCPLVGSDRNKSAPDSPSKSRVDAPFAKTLYESDSFTFGGDTIRTLETPGHTPEHICLYFEDNKILLAGDTVFVMGCGRFSDGTADELYASFQKILQLPDETKIYVGHEYTLGNAHFGAQIEPENADIQSRLTDVKALREQEKPTVPTTLGLEKKTNVFLRAESIDTLAERRYKKDRFKG